MLPEDLTKHVLYGLGSTTAAASIATAQASMRSIAVRDRSQALVAEIPTVDEARLPRFYVPFWVALRAAKGTPKDVIAKLNSAAMTALADPTVSALLTDPGFEIYPRDQQTPQALAAYQKAEIKKWWPTIKEFGSKRSDTVSRPYIP